MKKILQKSKYIVGLAIGLILANCTTDFDEINTNPNSPESATPELLLPGILRQEAYDWAGYGWAPGNLVVQYSARIQFTDDDRYIWDPASSPYESGYDALRDVLNIIETSKDSELLQGYYGVGLIVKSWIMSKITDAYGDAPYSDATKGKLEGNFAPKFDAQSDIYDGILADLKLANEILTNSENITGDILYNGDVSKWRKFANSLRLRLLMRISDVSNSFAVSEMQEIVNNPSQYPIFEGNSDMAAVEWNAQNPQPQFETRSGSYDEIRVSTTLVERLKDLNDVRLKVFASPTADSGAGFYSENWEDYSGVPNGLNDEDALAYNGGSNFISRIGVLFTCDACSEYASATAAETIIMSYSELQFILAEAKTRGFISEGDAQSYYQNGIVSSFEYYKGRIDIGGWSSISDELQEAITTINEDYLSQEGVALNGTTSQNLSKIYLQKWISLFNTGFEAWSDWRRTAQPEVVPGPASSNNGKTPVRFLFPTSVKSTNNSNYQAAVQNMGPDNLNTRLWWDVSDNQ